VKANATDWSRKLEQVTLNFEAGLAQAYPTLREFVAYRTHHQGRPQKSIAADLDYSPSHWTRKCAQVARSARFEHGECPA